jgi:hypothetical protein
LVFLAGQQTRPAGAKTAPGGKMQLAGPKNGGLVYTERDLEIQNGNSSLVQNTGWKHLFWWMMN